MLNTFKKQLRGKQRIRIELAGVSAFCISNCTMHIVTSNQLSRVLPNDLAKRKVLL